MRSLYQVSAWNQPNAGMRSLALSNLHPERLGSPAGFFSPAPFLPKDLGMGQLIKGRDYTVPMCLCTESSLGQACATPTAGGTGGTAEFSPTDGQAAGKGDSTIVTVAVLGGVGVAALYFLGVI